MNDRMEIIVYLFEFLHLAMVFFALRRMRCEESFAIILTCIDIFLKSLYCRIPTVRH